MANDQSDNVKRLRALMKIFDISISDLADAGRVSRPLVSGLLSGQPGIKANGLFARLEGNLGVLVGTKRRRPFFGLPGVSVDEAEVAVQAAMPSGGFRTAAMREL